MGNVVSQAGSRRGEEEYLLNNMYILAIGLFLVPGLFQVSKSSHWYGNWCACTRADLALFFCAFCLSPPSTNRGWRGPSSQDAIENFQGGSGGASSEPLRDVAASKAKGKMARARHGHVASSQGDSRVLSRAGRSVGRAGGIDRGKRMQDEDEDDEDDDESDDGNPFWGMGSGGGALAALPGTQVNMPAVFSGNIKSTDWIYSDSLKVPEVSGALLMLRSS